MPKLKLLEQMRNAIRLHQYSQETERAYLYWVKRFIIFHDKKHPASMEKKEIEAFLTHLAVNRGVAPSTQNLALSAILFLYQKVLDIELSWLDDVVRAKPKQRVPVVLSTQEVPQLFPAGIYTAAQYAKQLLPQPAEQVFISELPATPSVILLQPTYWNQAPTYEPSNNCLGTVM